MEKAIRLDKLLGHSGWGTRRQIKLLCKHRHVTVNGKECLDNAAKVVLGRDRVEVDGSLVRYVLHYYIMLHKPCGVLSATADRFCRTVLNLLPRQYAAAGLFPVGRLDKDTTGLLLLTNNGEWAHKITSPKKHINKVYKAQVDGTIPSDIDERFHQGLVLSDGLQCLPACAQRVGGNRLEITVQEGKFHQVKRMCAAVGLTVLSLHRQSVGGLLLDPTLEPGAFRSLSEVERDLPFI